MQLTSFAEPLIRVCFHFLLALVAGIIIEGSIFDEVNYASDFFPNFEVLIEVWGQFCLFNLIFELHDAWLQRGDNNGHSSLVLNLRVFGLKFLSELIFIYALQPLRELVSIRELLKVGIEEDLSVEANIDLFLLLVFVYSRIFDDYNVTLHSIHLICSVSPQSNLKLCPGVIEHSHVSTRFLLLVL